jgi:cytochrome bd-type quinol oxidase subunit 1
VKHRWPTALGIAVATLTAFDLEVGVGFVSFLSALTVLMALVYLGAAVLNRRWSAWVALLAGMLGFGAIALAALYADTVLGGYLVAAALLGHAVWDAVYLRLDRVVARSYAEFCGVLDLLLGAAIIFP